MMAMTPGGLWWSTQVKPVRKKKRKPRGGKLKALSVSSTTSALSTAATATVGPAASLESAASAPKEAPDAPPRATGPRGLHAACRIGLPDRVAALVAAGADVSARDVSLDETPLHCAARRCHILIARMLIEAGADCAARTPSDLLASELVQPPNRYSMVRELLQAAEADAARAAAAADAAARRLKLRAEKARRAPARDQSRGLSTHVNSLQAESCWVLAHDSSLSAPSLVESVEFS